MGGCRPCLLVAHAVKRGGRPRQTLGDLYPFMKGISTTLGCNLLQTLWVGPPGEVGDRANESCYLRFQEINTTEGN